MINNRQTVFLLSNVILHTIQLAENRRKSTKIGYDVNLPWVESESVQVFLKLAEA